MMHMEPHILDFDPHSGDFGLGFFGCSLQSGAYYVHHPKIGPSCNLATAASGAVTIKPTDLYHRRVYIEPLGLYVTLDIGTIALFPGLLVRISLSTDSDQSLLLTQARSNL